MNDFIECVKDNLEEINDRIDEIELQLKDLPCVYDPIYNVNNFIDELKKNCLYSEEIKEFIETYMRFYNE